MLARENVLPVGSVVTLEGSPKGKFLITGYYPIVDDSLYDYCAVTYPLGEKAADSTLVFHADKIDAVLHEGFRNLSFDMLLDALDAGTKQLQEALDAGNLHIGN